MLYPTESHWHLNYFFLYILGKQNQLHEKKNITEGYKQSNHRSRQEDMKKKVGN